ncbi:MAG: hypothetical protein EOL91_11375 [Actinobacteria bacterium]|nr:hypothetical protein [Actinomycetota bacterium]
MIIGIDPGVSGGIALLDHKSFQEAIKYDPANEQEVVDKIRGYRVYIKKAYLEAVHSMPGQGVASTFKFGMNYGWWQGVLVSFRIPFERVSPVRWQTEMRCRTKGDKNVTKRLAQELFPNIKVTHAIADALLIAEYGLRRDI